MSPEAAPLLFDAAEVGYGDSTIVTGVELAVRAGEFVGLVGPNGSGKTTLLRSVSGAADVKSGRLDVADVPTDRLSARERARIVGVVPQSLLVTFAFTARQFVEMGRDPWLGRLSSLSPSDHELVARTMERTDTVKLADQMIDTLSGGDLQRLTLAQALVQEPRVLLLDESTSHLDLNHRLQVLDLVRELAEGGLAVLAVFHDLDLAARYSDRIAVVADGTVSPVGTPDEVLTPDMLAEVFKVKAVVNMDPVTGSATVTPILRDESLTRVSDVRVMLVCGSGTGASLMRRLSLEGVAVSCAALNSGDVDQGVAEALGLKHVELPPFDVVDEDAERAVGELAADADVCVVCSTPFGGANVGNLRAAVAARTPLLLIGDLGPARDYSHGEAADLWSSAIARGARRVDDEDGAVAALKEMVARSAEHGGPQPARDDS